MTDAMISRMELDKSFVPPFPPRPAARPPLREALKIARRNLIAIFTERDYLNRQMRARKFGFEFMICNNPGGAREALGDQADAFAKRSPMQRRALEPLLGKALIASDGAAWEARHDAVAPLVGAACPAAPLAAARQAALARCAAFHAAGPGATLDIVSETERLATDFAARLVFGDVLAERHGAALAADIALFQRSLSAVDPGVLIGLPRARARKTAAAGRAAAERAKARVAAIVAQTSEGTRSLVAALLGRKDARGAPLDSAAVAQEALGLFFAGRETMAITLAFALYLVAESPRVRDRLAAELGEVLAGRLPTREDLANLTYTRAVLEETMRLYPPIPMLARVTTRRATVNGVLLKRGALFLPTPWLIHRNRAVWSLPDHFVPERFDTAHAPLRDPFSFLPFSVGAHGCPAATLSLDALTLILATLWQSFDMRVAPGHTVTPEARFFLRPGPMLPMRVDWRPAPAEAPGPAIAALTRAILEGYQAVAPADPVPTREAVGASIAIAAPEAAAAPLAKAHAKAESRAVAGYRTLPRLMSPGRLTREGEAHRDEALQSGRPILLVTVATSVDDLMAAALAQDFGERLMVLGGPSPAGVRAADVAAMRKTLRLPVVPPSPGAVPLLAARLAIPGTALAVSLDGTEADSVSFPLFGRAASDGIAAQLLAAAREAGALVLPVTLARQGGGHRLAYRAPVAAADLGQAPLATLNDVFEPFVREHLAEWRQLGALAERGQRVSEPR